MNTTEYFKRTIQAYLEERAMEDELFASKYDNPDKNIDDCVTYILNWVQKSGCNEVMTIRMRKQRSVLRDNILEFDIHILNVMKML